jgi:hypothetical protein
MAKRVLALIVVAMLGVAVAVPSRSSRAQTTADRAAADNCRSEPNGAAPQAGRWYYRTDRSTGRRCWSLRRQREKAKEARQVAPPRLPPRLRPSFSPIAEPKPAPRVEPAARAADPVPDVSMPLQSPPTSAAPIEPQSAPASDPPASNGRADEQLEKRSSREGGERLDEPSITSVPTAPDPAAGGAFNIRLEPMLALVAAALALAAVIGRKVVRLIVVRRLRRRRSALRSQWLAACAMQEPASAFATTAAAARHADVAHDAVAATRSADGARRPAGRRDPGHDIAESGIEDRGIAGRLRGRRDDARRATA